MTYTNITARADVRTAVLASMGAGSGTEWFTWPTATATVDLDSGVILVASDPDVAPDDMDAIVNLLELSGYHNGTDGPFTSDPGEPSEIMGLSTWSLSLGATLELS